MIAVGGLLWLAHWDWSAAVGLLIPLLLLTLILAWRLRNGVVFPLYTVSNLLEALREGDYSLRGARARRGDAMGEVIWEVNALSETLRGQRLRVEETLALLSKVLASIDIAILAFAPDGSLKWANTAAERLLGFAAGQAVGRRAQELQVDDLLASNTPTATVRRAFVGAAGVFEIRRAQFREGGLPHQLIAISDLSRVVREEERQAWQRLIRVLGHELNNSLTPIKSLSATLGAMLQREPLPEDWRDDARTALSTIADRADALARFMLGYTSLARLPAPMRREVELAQLAQHVVRLEHRLAVELQAGPALRISADPDQLEQALINLVKNAVDAALSVSGGVRARWRIDSSTLVIEIEDDGPGLAATENLFVPFFTTKPGGSGIGLVLARQIAEAHGGTLSLANRPKARGALARFAIPIQEVRS